MNITTLPLEHAEATCLAVLPDGDTCVVGCLTLGELYVVSLRTGELLRVLHAHPDSINGLSVAGEGRLLSSASYDDTVWVWDTATWSQTTALRHVDNVWALASTGTVAVAATSDVGAAQVWDLADGTCRGVLAAGADALVDVAVSPDGRWAATLNNDEHVLVWDLGSDPVLGLEEFRILANDYDYEEPIQLGRRVADTYPGDITAIGFDARGLLYTVGDAVVSWDPATGARLVRFPSNGEDIDALASHPSLPLVAVAESGTIRLCRTDGTELATWTTDGEPTVDLAFTSAGQLVGVDLAGTLNTWPAGA
ncbi:hypothetical protein GCM10029964_028670 [Kibdelosporangium lantanae]